MQINYNSTINGNDQFSKHIKIKLLESKQGFAKAEMPVTDEIKNALGYVHGGAYFTLADYTAAVASDSYGGTSMSVNATISYLRAVNKGKITAIAKTVKAGKHINYQTVEIFNDEQQLVAIFQGSNYRFLPENSN